MCGIVYVKRKDGKPAHKQLVKRYRKQRDRGEDGFGYIAISAAQKVLKYKRYQFEHEAITALESSKYEHVLFHHRYPTSTPNVPESAHPLKVSHQELLHDYYVVHNGVIGNDDDLKDEHEKLGYSYSTEVETQYKTAAKHVYFGAKQWNDSEALAIELARTIEGLQPQVKATGAAAFIVLQVEKTGNKKALALYYGTNGGNPLTIQAQDNFICIASEGGKAITDGIVYRLDLATDEITTVPSVKLIEYGRRSSTMGFIPYRSSDMFSGFDLSEGNRGDTLGSLAGQGVSSLGFEAMSLTELEEHLEDVDFEIEEAQELLAEAIGLGEENTEAMWLDEIRKLTELRNRIGNIYERKSNEIPF